MKKNKVLNWKEITMLDLYHLSPKMTSSNSNWMFHHLQHQLPYPKVSRELRSLKYGDIGPALKRMTRELRGLHSNLHIAYINSQVLPDHDQEYAMLIAASNSVAGFDDGSDTQKPTKMC
jgi:hypothetical protein